MFMYSRERLSEEMVGFSSVARRALARLSSCLSLSHQSIPLELHSAPAVTLIHSDRDRRETDPRSAPSFSFLKVDQGTGESFQLGHANG